MPEIMIDYKGMSLHVHRDGMLPVNGTAHIVRFIAALDGDLVASCDVSMKTQAWFHATTVVQRTQRLTGHPGRLVHDAMIRFGIREIRASLNDAFQHGVRRGNVQQHRELTIDDVPWLLAMLDDKDCDYRVRQRRDLFCTVAAPGDMSALIEIEGRRSAPTSRPLCRSCALPPADLVCSHLMHPLVSSVTDAGGIKSRDVFSALCDRGQKEVGEPEGCTAGGHSCWQTRVEVESVRPVRLPPLSVPEAFDITDLAWRLAFGHRERFRGKPGSMKNTAALAVDCADLEEFESRMSALADVIDQIWPSDSLLPTDIDAEKASKSLDRLTAVLLHRLPTSQHARVEDALAALRRIRQTRNALQHSRARGGLLGALRNLGIHDTSPSWDDTWNVVRAQTVDALKVLREELVQFSDTAPVTT